MGLRRVRRRGRRSSLSSSGISAAPAGPWDATDLRQRRRSHSSGWFDGVELAELLRKTLQRDKIILLGHSWGSISVFMAKAGRSLPCVRRHGAGRGSGEQLHRFYDALLKKAESSASSGPPASSRRSGRPPYADGRGYAVQRSGRTCSRAPMSSSRPCWALRSCARLPESVTSTTGSAARPRAVSAWSRRRMRSTPQKLAGDFALPVFVIQGAEDFTTPTALARSFIDSIRAPRKEFVADRRGPFAVFMKPAAFLSQLVGAGAAPCEDSVTRAPPSRLRRPVSALSIGQ